MWLINLLMSTLTVATVSSNIIYHGYTTIATPAPEFFPTSYNVTFLVGDLAKLTCSVANLGTKTVVWRRMDSSFPLTSGMMTVSADNRISVDHIEYKNQWDLLIKDVQLDDDGMYECQISSKDRTVRRIITLNVVEPEKVELKIQITATQYVERGERIFLQCNATGQHYPPDDMDWFRNGQKLTTDTVKGIRIDKKYSIPKRRFTSSLTIDRARMGDDGTYVCRSSSIQIASTKVIVLNAGTSLMKRGTEGEKNQAGSQSGPLYSSSNLTLSLALVLLTITHLWIYDNT